jgi:hypothetical protein
VTVQSYVIVSTDQSDLTIHGGPLAWDGVQPYNPGAGMQLMLTDAAIQASYSFPPPDPTVTNQQTLLQKAGNALANNATYLGLGTPTNAQVVAQVAALTRQVNALIRLTIGQLDSTSGT